MWQRLLKRAGFQAGIFLTSKVWKEDMGYERQRLHLRKPLEQLNTDLSGFVSDPLATVHVGTAKTGRNLIKSWRAMEELYHAGKIRAIGVSNFLPHHIENLMQNAKVTPAVDQLEYHPGYTQQAAVDYCRKNQILVEAWSPIGRRRVFEEPLILELSESIMYHRHRSVCGLHCRMA